MTTRTPTDGPDAALFRVARKLRLRYSNAFVVQAIAAHPRPTSLLALVEVARRMGLETTPAETNLEGLKEVVLPAVVHFNAPGAEGGFGVLERMDTSGFHVWDSSGGLQVMDPHHFALRWSGVVVLLRRADAPGAPEHRYVRQRLLEVLSGGVATPSVDAGPGAPLLRGLFAMLLLILCAAGIAALPRPERLPGIVVLVLALAGVAVTGLMASATGGHDDQLADRICRRGRLLDCRGVLTSRYSRLLGIPLSDIGLAFYGGVILLLASTSWLHAAAWKMASLAFVATVPFALVLIALQVSMKQLCMLCLTSHVTTVAGAAVGWTTFWNGTWRVEDLYLAIAFFLYSGGTLFFLIPYARRGRSLAFISERHHRMAASPFGTLAQLTTEEPIRLRGPDVGIPLDGSSGEHELVILVHPSCGKCLPVLREVVALPKLVAVRVFVGVAPKDPVERDRVASSLLVASWSVAGPDRAVECYIAAKKLFSRLTDANGRDLLAHELSLAPADVEARLAKVRPLVEAAERVVNEHAEGTPALFFDSRPFTGPVSHLAILLQKHPELLRSP